MAEHSVHLRIYDLSQGLAAQFSEAFLGKRIELIPHTGVVVFGLEYFFGGGIQRVHPDVVERTYGMQPVRTISLGHTGKTQQEAAEFLRSVAHKYTTATYDLLRNNCNNFSDEFARFLTGNGVPAEIINLPEEVLSTPAGAMLRPMLEQTQDAMAAHANGGDLAALAGAFSGTPVPGAASPGVTPTPTPAPAPAATAAGSAPQETAVAAPVQPLAAIVEEHKEPLLASDVTSLAASASHLLALGSEEDGGGATRCPLAAEHKGALRQVFMAGEADVAAVPAACAVLDRWPADRAAASALVILSRVLARTAGAKVERDADANEAAAASQAAAQVASRLGSGALDGRPLLVARALAWTCLANAAASALAFGDLRKHPQWGELLAAATRDTGSGGRVEVRRAAAGFLSNVARQAAGDPDLRIQLGCGMLDAVHTERDEVVQRNRLVAVAVLLLADSTGDLAGTLTSMSLHDHLARCADWARPSAQPIARAIDAHLHPR